MNSRTPAKYKNRNRTECNFNGDGFLDLGSANRDDGTFSVLMGIGDGYFEVIGTGPADKSYEVFIQIV